MLEHAGSTDMDFLAIVSGSGLWLARNEVFVAS